MLYAEDLIFMDGQKRHEGLVGDWNSPLGKELNKLQLELIDVAHSRDTRQKENYTLQVPSERRATKNRESHWYRYNIVRLEITATAPGQYLHSLSSR